MAPNFTRGRQTMGFSTIPGGTYELGWRFDIGAAVKDDPEAAELVGYQTARCSRRRTVSLAAFAIAREPIRLSEVIGSPYDLDAGTIAALCALVDSRLAEKGTRLATEDELEAAVGGSLFPWGDEIPRGAPYGKDTDFVGHKANTASGLVLLGDPYKVELTRDAFKLGDGGASLCGGDPWPVPWIALSPSFRLIDADVEDCFPETLEECFVRPVKR